jgi:Flp pilus assembly protein TadD
MNTFTALPDPAQAGSVDDIVERLRLLKIWAGDPSYETIKDRINTAWTAAGRPASELTIRSTVANCFTLGRRRLNTDLILAVVEALHPDVGYVTQWRQALRVVSGEIEAVAQVRVQDSLPRDLAGFTGRITELGRLRRAREAGDAVVISAIEGMAGVGKTQLAIHAGHLLHREEPFDRVLFVNLRGFHPNPTQPPADPAAVLDGFLRLLGTPGNRIPHGLADRATAYRDRLAGVRALIVLDNAATAEQVGPLLPGTPGCLTLVTSRRILTGLQPGDRLTVDVFSPDEAATFLTGAVPAGGTDPDAIARITRRCGYLPLALSLIAGHIRNTAGWTLADHADRLDERHDGHRLDSGVELALDLSYQHLPAAEQRLFRLVSLHPGQDFDGYAAAALAGTDLAAAQASLDHLLRDHLLQQATPGRYTFHDLVRAFAAVRGHDEDRPADRRAALTRLFDHYLGTAAAATTALYPAADERRPRAVPAGTPMPDLTDPDRAVAWLDTERPTLVAVSAHTATHGWPGHTVRLSHTLARYLNGGYHTEALTVHGHGRRAAEDGGDLAGQAHALVDAGVAQLRLGRLGPATDDLQPALELFRQIDDPSGQARALNGLGHALEQAGRFPAAIDTYDQALTLARQTDNRNGEAYALQGLADVEVQAGRYEPAGDHLRQALSLNRQLGDRTGEAGVLDSLGLLHTRLGRFDQATDCHQQAVAVFREVGVPEGEAWALNGLGEAAQAAGRPADAVGHHTAACAVATEVGARTQQARAESGLAAAQRALAAELDR